jgi:hypothetical protein
MILNPTLKGIELGRTGVLLGQVISKSREPHDLRDGETATARSRAFRFLLSRHDGGGFVVPQKTRAHCLKKKL